MTIDTLLGGAGAPWFASDLALVAVLVAFSSTLVVATLWFGAWVRLDRLASFLSGRSTTLPRYAAAIFGLAALCILLGYVPGTTMLLGGMGLLSAGIVLGAMIFTSLAALPRRSARVAVTAQNVRPASQASQKAA